MRKHILLIAFAGLLLSATAAHGEDLCPLGVPSDRLICLLPHVYGVNGLVLGNFGASHFKNDFLTSNLRPLNSAIARQSALLPLASPSSGITFSWDPIAKIAISSTESFGPILGERSETVGEHLLFVGFSYQRFKFENLDGLDLTDLPVVYTQPDFELGSRTCSINGDSTTQCGFIRDVIKTTNKVTLDADQFTTFLAFGLTNRLDVAMAIPVQRLRMSVTSDAAIVDNSNSRSHFFVCGSSPCAARSFTDSQSVSGMGDMTLRVKGTAWKGERGGVALGADIRFPTGSDLDLLGSGAAGVKPFIAWSYRSRVSPNMTIGFETNGSSRIAGDISTGTKERLPDQLTYSAGADVWATDRISAAVNVVGQQVFQSRRTLLSSFEEPAACLDTTGNCDPARGFAPPNKDSNLVHATGSYNISNLSLGLRVRPFSGLLLTGNVLLKLNDGGLRPDIVPLFGASYTFAGSAP